MKDELKFSKNIDQKKHLNKTRKILEKYIYQNISFFRPRWMWNWKAKRKWLFNESIKLKVDKLVSKKKKKYLNQKEKKKMIQILKMKISLSQHQISLLKLNIIYLNIKK